MIPSTIVLIASLSLIISVCYDLTSSYVNDGKMNLMNSWVSLFRLILSSVAFFISYQTTNFWWIALAFAWCIIRLFSINYFIFTKEGVVTHTSFRYSLILSAVIITIYYLYGCFDTLSSYIY
jgi:hypothetical protein